MYNNISANWNYSDIFKWNKNLQKHKLQMSCFPSCKKYIKKLKSAFRTSGNCYKLRELRLNMRKKNKIMV